MKTLELEQMEIVIAGEHANCSTAEGAVAAAVSLGWILGPIGWAVAMGIAGTYWTNQCGPSDY